MFFPEKIPFYMSVKCAMKKTINDKKKILLIEPNVIDGWSTSTALSEIRNLSVRFNTLHS